MPSGGKREGAGRKPRTEAAEPVDGRTSAGREWAARLIAALNNEAEVVVSGDTTYKLTLTKKEAAEVNGWRELWDAQDLRIRLDVRKYLHDKRDGKAMQPVAGPDGGAIAHNHYVFEAGGGVKRA